MARRYASMTLARFRIDRAAEAWRSLVDLVRSSASAPGYAGPTIEEVERVLVGIEATRKSIAAWRGAEAAKAEAGCRMKTSAASRAKAERRRQRRAKAAAPASPEEVHRAAAKFMKSARAKRAMAQVQAILDAAR